MIILFMKQFIEKILSGEKTVTRRTNPKWSDYSRIGKTFTARAGRTGKGFVKLRIVSIYYEEYPAAERNNEQEAFLEGFGSWYDFVLCYQEINGEKSINEPCYRIEFKVAK